MKPKKMLAEGQYEAEMEARAKDDADRDYAYDQEQSYQGGEEGC